VVLQRRSDLPFFGLVVLQASLSCAGKSFTTLRLTASRNALRTRWIKNT